MNAQHTLGWYRDRLGKITGSRCGLLTKRGKERPFTEAATSYIYRIAAERQMNPAIVMDDEMFESYLEQVDISTKAMKWGSEQEGNVRDLYEQLTGRHIVEVGSTPHPTIQGFNTSPDGYYYNEETGERGCIEIKCLAQDKFMRYLTEVHSPEQLLAINYEYYWQCVAHMMCMQADWTDFIVYNPFQRKPIHVVRVLKDETAFRELESRITLANALIGSIINIK